MRNFRSIAYVEILVSVNHISPPKDWQESKEQQNYTMWISPSMGRMRLITQEQLFKGDEPESFSIICSHASIQANCPTIDITTIFLLNLATDHFTDLLRIARTTKLPVHLEQQIWMINNETIYQLSKNGLNSIIIPIHKSTLFRNVTPLSKKRG